MRPEFGHSELIIVKSKAENDNGFHTEDGDCLQCGQKFETCGCWCGACEDWCDFETGACDCDLEDEEDEFEDY